MSSTLSSRELNFLGQVWQCLKTAPDVDMDKLFAMADYKTKASTSTAYHRLKAKILAAGDAAEDGEADVEDSGVPPSATKKGGKKAAPVKTEESEDEDDEAKEAVPTKLTASGRPSRAAAPKPAASKSARAARPVVTRATRATRASARTNKVDVQVSEDSDEDTIKPVGKGRAIKRGSTPEEDWNTMSGMIQQAAGLNPTPDPEDTPTPARGIKRAATKTPSDAEDVDVKRVKGEDDDDDDNEVEVETPAASDAASNAASFGDTVPSDFEIDMTADLTLVTDVEELAPFVHEI